MSLNMKLYFYVANLLLLIICFFEVTEQQSGPCKCTRLGSCLTKALNSYTIPMIPCFNRCAVTLDKAQVVTQCFDSQHPEKYGEGVQCFKSEAGCTKKRYVREAVWLKEDIVGEQRWLHEDTVDDEHVRLERSAANTTTEAPAQKDIFLRVIDKAVNDKEVHSRLTNFRRCKLDCYFSHHGVPKPKRPKRQAQQKPNGHGSDYFFKMFGSCYEWSSCPMNVTADKCMPKFFTKRDPKVFCGCLHNYYGSPKVNCESVFSEPNVSKDSGGHGLHSHPSIDVVKNRPS